MDARHLHLLDGIFLRHRVDVTLIDLTRAGQQVGVSLRGSLSNRLLLERLLLLVLGHQTQSPSCR